jgi:RsiW-degrading membrane proteinase PrsW (M82 family)
MAVVLTFVSTHLGYLLLTFLPPVLWLVFYLQEDRSPEPKLLLLLTFIGGMASTFLALLTEIFLLGEEGILAGIAGIGKNVFLYFLVIGLVEEYVKYLPVKFLILRRKDFDEPVDAMIYLMTSALGFAALENIHFVFPLLQQDIFSGIELSASRFLGANLLHALSSGIVGFFLARAFFSPRRPHFVAVGISFASLLHAAFNYLILEQEGTGEGTFYLIALLSTMAIMVFVDFERLKKQRAGAGQERNQARVVPLEIP